MGADGENFFLDEPARGLQVPRADPAAAHAAAHGLAQRFPQASARRVLLPEQRRALTQLASAAGIAALLAPALFVQTIGLLGAVGFALILGWRIFLFAIGGTSKPNRTDDAPEASLPVYTLLIALKDEAASIPQLAAAIAGLDYPQAHLDLKLIVETGDIPTADAIRDAAWPAQTELLVVPRGSPRTKPRALNYGLARARGEFVVVYDAEDRPDAQQLTSAVSAFRAGGERLACVQAPLVGTGAGGWIAGQWALEYAIQFGRLLPAQTALSLPIALGGTSNHFRREALEAAGGWDAWNVTEDADLGLRFARGGWQVGMIAPPTLEAAPRHLGVWIAQRSRWLKGYLQTWLVQMRDPARAWRELGPRGFVSLQLGLGGTILSALVHGPWALFILAALLLPSVTLAPVWAMLAAASYLAGGVMGLVAPGPINARRVILALTLPLYWPLQTIAMARAIYGLISCPHFWAKTPHEEALSIARSDAA